jgi:hypothetical protein
MTFRGRRDHFHTLGPTIVPRYGRGSLEVYLGSGRDTDERLCLTWLRQALCMSKHCRPPLTREPRIAEVLKTGWHDNS